MLNAKQILGKWWCMHAHTNILQGVSLKIIILKFIWEAAIFFTETTISQTHFGFSISRVKIAYFLKFTIFSDDVWSLPFYIFGVTAKQTWKEVFTKDLTGVWTQASWVTVHYPCLRTIQDFLLISRKVMIINRIFYISQGHSLNLASRDLNSSRSGIKFFCPL